MAKDQDLDKHTPRGETDIREFVTDPDVLREAERGWPDNGGIPAFDSSAAILAALNSVTANAYYEKVLNLRGLTLGVGSAIKPTTGFDSFTIYGGIGRANNSAGKLVATAASYSAIARSTTGYARALLQLEQQQYMTLNNVNFDLRQTHVGAIDTVQCFWLSINNCSFTRPQANIRHAIITNTTNLVASGLCGSWPSNSTIGTRVEVWAWSGSSVPTGYTVGQPYWINGSSGSTRSVSATLGGSTVTPSDTGSGTWGFVFGAATITAVNTGTKTLTAVAHGRTNGERVTCYNSSTLWTDTTGTSIPFAFGYVINAAADTFQVAATPGGSAISLNAYVAGARVIPFCPALDGGGNLYGEVRGNIFQHLNHGLQWNSTEAGGGVYGDNVITLADNYSFNSAISISGHGGGVYGGTFEGEFVQAALTIGGDTSTIAVRDIYTEHTASSSPAVSIAVAQGVCAIAGCELNGAGPSDGGSAGVRSSVLGNISVLSVSGNKIGSFERSGRVLSAVGAPQALSMVPAAWGINNEQNCSGGFLAWPTQQFVDPSHALNIDINYMNEGREISRPIYKVPNKFLNTGSGLTAFDARWGDNIVLNNNVATTLSTITFMRFGYDGRVTCENTNTTFGSAAFKTLSGADYTPLAGETVRVVCNSDNSTVGGQQKPNIEHPFGSVVARLSGSALAAGVSAANIFSGAPTAGTYSIEGEVVIATGASAGTGAFVLTYNGGPTTLNVLGYSSLASTTARDTGFDFTASQTIRFSSQRFSITTGNPQFAVTLSGLTAGSLAYSYRFDIRRHS